jgi:hypothetical protein
MDRYAKFLDFPLVPNASAKSGKVNKRSRLLLPLISYADPHLRQQRERAGHGQCKFFFCHRFPWNAQRDSNRLYPPVSVNPFSQLQKPWPPTMLDPMIAGAGRPSSREACTPPKTSTDDKYIDEHRDPCQQSLPAQIIARSETLTHLDTTAGGNSFQRKEKANAVSLL